MIGDNYETEEFGPLKMAFACVIFVFIGWGLYTAVTQGNRVLEEADTKWRRIYADCLRDNVDACMRYVLYDPDVPAGRHCMIRLYEMAKRAK